MPKLSPPNFSGKMSVLFPLVDVSGSMHAKLEDAKSQICSKFLESSDANMAALMAFTTKPHLIVPVSGMESPSQRAEFSKAVQSLFIPAESGTNIPNAVIAYLQTSRGFLEQVPVRPDADMWKTYCVIITDGLHKVAARPLWLSCARVWISIVMISSCMFDFDQDCKTREFADYPNPQK